jgi:uncharacterized protein YjbI with pentapeptide repeats
MANPEHIDILYQGAKIWNEWKRENPNPDLSDSTLLMLVLDAVDFSDTNLRGADLSYSEFVNVNFAFADLRGTTLNHTIFRVATFLGAKLGGATLSQAMLALVDLTDARLDGADFSDAVLHGAVFGDNDLSGIKGLEKVRHHAPSTIGIDTLSKSFGNVSEQFLRGCGLSDWQIEHAKLYRPELSNEEITNILYQVHNLRAHQAIQISSLFISYSHTDGPFIDAMETYLNERGVRFWRDVHHSTAGRLERQIDRAIRLNPTVLLVLSEHSVSSDWVEHEARLARKLEQETGRDVLCPVALDDSWKTCRWPERLREQIMEYNVLDFSNWQDPDYMRRMFTRLVEGLGLFYK